MFKLLRVFTRAVTLMIAFLPALAACNYAQPAVLITPAPTITAAKPIATTAAATPVAMATKVVSTTTEATSTPLAAKPTATPIKSSSLMTATQVATTAAETASASVAAKASPTAVKPAAVKATPAAVKPATGQSVEVKLQLAKNDKLGEILTDAQGMTLYTFKNDKPGESTCVDVCAKTWPPLLVAKESDKPLLGQNVTGKLGVIERKDGAFQVTYNDMPLYYYAQDTKPGDTKGQAFKDLWYAVTMSTPQASEAAAKPGEATTWTVLVGGEAGVEQQETGPAGAWQFMRFYPETLTINAGDTIIWKQNSAEPHTVTFLKPGDKTASLVIPEGTSSQRMIFNPDVIMPQGSATYDGTTLTGSGQMGGEPQFPTEYKLTFTKPGTYEYICAFHPMMIGKIIVQAAGKSYPQTQAQIDTAAKAQLEADTQAALKVKPETIQAATRAGTKGSTIHEVKIGYGDGLMAWMRFSPADLTINIGDTVEWKQADTDTPHTVSFLDQGKEPEMVLVEKQTTGPPNLVLNPEVLQPAGGATYSGQGYFNSGFIWGTKDPTPGPRTYTLTFDKAGTYKYTCILHDGMGMRGTITVKSK
jgi:plastocyanin/predicted lipoprotein with Yx(FWY)xxD motif